MSSEGDSPRREWYFYLDDMIGFAEKVLSYTHDIDRAKFDEAGLEYDATLRNVELIGEAATRIPEETKAKASDIPWRQIIATRNRLIHGYLGIDKDTLWSIVQTDIPALIPQLKALRSGS